MSASKRQELSQQTSHHLPVEPLPILADLHGFSDTAFKNDYITPRGLLVTNRGATLQSVDLLQYDVYHETNAPIFKVTVIGGVFLDVNPGYRAPNTNSFNVIDYIGGESINFARDWSFSAEYIQFDSPQSAFFVKRNVEAILKYDDSGFNKMLLYLQRQE